MRTLNLHLLVLSIVFITVFTSCDSKQNITDETICTDHFISEFNMKPYEGEDLDCKTHIRLYEYQDVFFALKLNHCADFAPFTIYDCNGEEFCFTSVGPCYIQESIDLGIIGIEK